MNFHVRVYCEAQTSHSYSTVHKDNVERAIRRVIQLVREHRETSTRIACHVLEYTFSISNKSIINQGWAELLSRP